MTRIERVTLHQIDDEDTGDSYRVDVLLLADGSEIGYRVDADETGGFSLTPAENAITEALRRRDQ